MNELIVKSDNLVVVPESDMQREINKHAHEQYKFASSIPVHFVAKKERLYFDDQPVKGNKVLCIIMGFVPLNTYYEGKYDPSVKAYPTCFAIGNKMNSNGDLVPHEDMRFIGNPQSERCDNCPRRKTKIVDGKPQPKECRPRVRLSLIPAGRLNQAGEWEVFSNPSYFETCPFSYMNLPPTSIYDIKAYIRQTVNNTQRALYCSLTEISVVEDRSLTSGWSIKFRNFFDVDESLIPIIYKRLEEANAEIGFSMYTQKDDEETES